MISHSLFFLNPGEMIFAQQPSLIKTVLGSCIAVTLHDSEKKIGGICHFLLPYAPKDELSTKYGNVAISLLLRKFINLGSKKNKIVAKIFGGASVLLDEKEIFFVGERNIEVAMKILTENNITIKEMNVGGEFGRKLLFYTDSGLTVVETITKMGIRDLYNSKI